jgi:glycosyltransferase involved in cell wall biosynthesis
MADQLTIAHAVLSLGAGGLEQVVLDLVRQAAKSGERAQVLCVECPGELAGQVASCGGEFICLEKGPGLKLGTIAAAKRALRQLKPDVVHAHQVGALLYVGPAAKSLGVPVVHTEHGKHFGPNRRSRWIGRIAGRYAAHFLAVSQDIANDLQTFRIVPKRKIGVVANGINLDRFARKQGSVDLRNSLGIPADAPVVGTIGRLNEVKRQDLLLEAFAELRKRLPNACLLLVGDGPAMAQLRELANRLQLTPNVRFAGYQAKPEQCLAAMDVFALTSRSEGMPLVVLEACAAGVPVVATQVGGLVEMITSGKNGLLVPFGNHASLVDSLHMVLSQPNLHERLRNGGRQWVESRYSVDRMAADYHRYYVHAIGARQQTSEASETYSPAVH